MCKLLIRSALILTALLMVRNDFFLFAAMRNSIGDDFWVYLTGSWVLRGGPATDLYEAAGRNVDPSAVYYPDLAEEPAADRAFIETGRNHGIPVTRVYTYPPTLADLMIPLTFLSPKTALEIFYILNAAALIGIGALLAQLIAVNVPGKFVLCLAFTALFPAVVWGLLWGQIPLLMLFMLLAGLCLYLRGRLVSAAFLLALAAAIKLTPFILLFPLFAWRDWKMIRAIVSWALLFFAIIVAFNGWAALHLYFFHEMQKIGMDVDLNNRTLGSVLQIFSLRRASGPYSLELVRLGKLVGFAIICFATWLSRRNGDEPASHETKIHAFAAFFLLSCCVAPLSWEHAYIIAVPLLLIWVIRTWREAPTWDAVLLILLCISFSTFRFKFLFVLTPLLGIAISLMTMYRLRSWRGGWPRSQNPH
jgi:hypothetical protein